MESNSIYKSLIFAYSIVSESFKYVQYTLKIILETIDGNKLV